MSSNKLKFKKIIAVIFYFSMIIFPIFLSIFIINFYISISFDENCNKLTYNLYVMSYIIYFLTLIIKV